MNKAKYDEGYQAAIDAIKDILNNNGNNQDGGGGGMQLPNNMDTDLGDTEAGKKSQQQGNNGQATPMPGSSESSGRGQGSQGTVSPQDCTPMMNDDAGMPGGFTDANEGNKIAKEEGYTEGPGDEANSQQWKEAALEAAKKGHGNIPGSLIEKIHSQWKTNHDWKKSLRKIVGRSLNLTDKRQAYANKNILVGQGRIARTDKDKYNSPDYISMFVDSSGSMTNKELEKACCEVYNIALALKPIRLVYGTFDTVINDIQEFNDANSFKKYIISHGLKGRGGTDAHAVWEYLLSNKKYKNNPAELMVVVSDGDDTCATCKRNPKIASNLLWIQFNKPGWETNFKEPKTFTVHLDSHDMK